MTTTQKKQENPLINILITIILPFVILSRLSGDDKLGVELAIGIALSFPLGYGLYEFIKDKKINFIAILGFINTLLTGTFTFLTTRNVANVSIEWFAIKEAAVPLLIGLAIIISLKTKYPLVKKLLYNDMIIDIDKVEESLERLDNKTSFESLLIKASFLLSISFLVSSILNYVLAKWILVSPPGSVAFNEELGQMGLYSFPVIAVPSMIVMGLTLWFLLNGLKKMTQLDVQDILKVKES